MRLQFNQAAIDLLWDAVNGSDLRLKGDPHSPSMRAAALMISPDDGFQVKLIWAHEGNIKTEWVSIHLLEGYRAK